MHRAFLRLLAVVLILGQQRRGNLPLCEPGQLLSKLFPSFSARSMAFTVALCPSACHIPASPRTFLQLLETGFQLPENALGQRATVKAMDRALKDGKSCDRS